MLSESALTQIQVPLLCAYWHNSPRWHFPKRFACKAMQYMEHEVRSDPGHLQSSRVASRPLKRSFLHSSKSKKQNIYIYTVYIFRLRQEPPVRLPPELCTSRFLVLSLNPRDRMNRAGSYTRSPHLNVSHFH